MKHILDAHPIPNEPHLYINELDLMDPNANKSKKEIETPGKDVIRVYIPLDLSYRDIMRRLGEIDRPDRYKQDPWYCSGFRQQVEQVIKQLEIYDQIRAVRNMKANVDTHPEEPGHKHSPEGIELAAEIVNSLEEYEDSLEGMLEELRVEFGL